MRITAEEASKIVDLARRHFGEYCTIRLFGSRTDDSKRGGDIDLHITVGPGTYVGIQQETQYISALWAQLDEQKIDIVFQAADAEDGMIDRIAKKSGIVLWPTQKN